MALIADNLAYVRERIATAAEQSGRKPEEITLVAVTKMHPATVIAEAAVAGVSNVGENYVQETAQKRDLLAASQVRSLQWHMLGHLQSNKAAVAVELFDLIQSVDSVRLARLIGRYAAARNQQQPILLQVHLGNESTKYGLPGEMIVQRAAQVGTLEGIDLCGLMGIAPAGEDPRPHFRQLRRLFEELPAEAQRTLSMGMTGDFEVAIEEGSTMVRIGTALFGSRRHDSAGQ